MSHSYYLSEKYDVALEATFEPYMSPTIWSKLNATSNRTNLVLLDRDSGVDPSKFESLKLEFPDLKVKVAVDMPQDELYGNLSIAKVVVDGQMVGMERIVPEGRIAGAVPIVERALVGANSWDMDFIPDEHLFVRTDNYSSLITAVRDVLRCYECEIAKTDGWVDRERERAPLFNKHVATVMAANAHFVIAYCSKAYQEPLLTAASVLISMPFSTVEILLPAGCRLEFQKTRAAYWKHMGIAGMHPAITLTEMDQYNGTSCNAPNITQDYPIPESKNSTSSCFISDMIDNYIATNPRREIRQTYTIFTSADVIFPSPGKTSTLIFRCLWV